MRSEAAAQGTGINTARGFAFHVKNSRDAQHIFLQVLRVAFISQFHYIKRDLVAFALQFMVFYSSYYCNKFLNKRLRIAFTNYDY